MVDWANGKYAGRQVQFLMICRQTGDEGLKSATWFGRNFKIPRSVVNGYIDTDSEVPTFGQLGCSGFIVLGPDGEFVAEKTEPAFLEEGQEAFEAVEELLRGCGVQPNEEAAAKELSPKQPVAAFQSAPVGNAKMDEEHEQLSMAVANVLKVPNIPKMEKLRDAWIEHCKHEEALFERHDFGQHRTRGELSDTASHCKHHRVIITMLDTAIEDCSQSVLRLVDEDTVKKIVSEMQRHSDVYDSAYAGKLPC
jgi:hypothetical protein